MATITLGSSPAFEACVQTTDPDYNTKALDECRRYLRGLETYYRSHRRLPVPFQLQIVVRTTDTTRYMEVAALCETDYAESEAQWLQDHLPETWEDLA